MIIKIIKVIKIVSFITVIFSNNISAIELEWEDKPFQYYANNDSLRNLLTNFAMNYGISTSISGRISEKVNGNFSPKTPTEFLKYISGLYNLTWYYDGAILYVYKATEVKTALIQLSQISISDLKNTLVATGIWDKRFVWKPLIGKGSVYVAGPPRYIELIKEIVSVLEQHQRQQLLNSDDFFIEIIPLKYASAVDRSVSYRNREISVPGIATVLDNILTGVEVNIANNIDVNKANIASVKSAGVKSKAMVRAEPGLNAIIVRDSRARLPLYRRLIEQLDKPQIQIEVGLSIIDVNVNDLEQLGIDWKGGIDIGTNKILDIKSTGDLTASTELSNGLDFTSVIDQTNLNFLLARVNLLQTEGSAQVVSRPMLLTQENVQAVLSTSETFYVKLIGIESQSLQPVTSGMIFKIVPRIVGDRYSQVPEINLSLQIEDGSRLNDGDIDGLPSTRKTEMSTLATVKQGQSLLIGGVYRDEITQQLRKVPLLGDIPYIGSLFRSQVNAKRRTVRLFIVEPRIVTEALGNNIVIGNAQDIRSQVLEIEDISNNNKGFRDSVAIYQCKPLKEALRQQQNMVRKGVSSSRRLCDLPTGEPGVRVIPGQCDEFNPSCFAPLR